MSSMFTTFNFALDLDIFFCMITDSTKWVLVDSICCLDNEKYLYSASVGAGTITILFLMQL